LPAFREDGFEFSDDAGSTEVVQKMHSSMHIAVRAPKTILQVIFASRRQMTHGAERFLLMKLQSTLDASMRPLANSSVFLTAVDLSPPLLRQS